jgi:hypothetical protein
MFDSKLLPLACHAWRLKPDDEKTWDTICTFFTDHANDRSDNITAGEAGFHANHVEEALTDINGQMANLAVRNDSQATTITNLRIELAAAKAALNAYKDANRSNNNTSFSNTTRRTYTYNQYCWTHGHGEHTSRACRNKNTGHRDDATATNTMGGTQTNMHRTA